MYAKTVPCLALGSSRAVHDATMRIFLLPLRHISKILLVTGKDPEHMSLSRADGSCVGTSPFFMLRADFEVERLPAYLHRSIQKSSQKVLNFDPIQHAGTDSD